MNRTVKEILRAAAAVGASAMLCAVAALGWLDAADGFLSDALYQRTRPTDGEIVIIGMDQAAVDAFGPMPWPRSVMAEAIAVLNADPDSRPAAIGIDVLYVGEGADPAADECLAEAAGEADNVVVSAAAVFGPGIVADGNGGQRFDPAAVLAWDRPFPALADAAAFGHINVMADGDGILRHALLYVDTEEDGRVYSMPRAVYERWCAAKGEPPTPLPSTDSRGFFYVPMTSGHDGCYDGFSVADLVSGTLDPAYYAGKIVLIGPYAAGMQDEYRTAVDHAVPLYGIEFQANLIDAFRRGFFPTEVSARVQLGILFALSCAALLFFWDQKVRHIVAVWLGLTLGWVCVCAGLFRAGWVLHVLWVPLAVTVLFVWSVAVNYIRAQRERRRVTDTFGHYVDPAILRELLDRGGSALELGGSMKEIAVLFVDIRGFTTMSEALDPPTVVEIINQYLTLTTECIMRWHGTLDKFVGDCTMAFWNAPLPQEDAAYLACKAAMDMVEGSKEVGARLMERFGRTVSFGVGVHMGPAVVGNIGAPMRMDYTAIGDTVNTAARLEANAPGGAVYISRAVAEALGNRADTTSLGGSIRLKGKAEGFEVLTLDALR